ncbi:MAG: DUF4347 domain-containing protein [Mariniblastus sp.]|nr:DUF4347 domain-containing protein [Mariniblastus sp.]
MKTQSDFLKTVDAMPSMPIRPAGESICFVSNVDLVALEDRVLYDASPLVACAQDILESAIADEDFGTVTLDASPIDAFDSGFFSSVIESFDDFSSAQASIDATPSNARQLVVIDGQVGDVDSLINDIRSQKSNDIQFDIAILEKDSDGIEQITGFLDGREHYDAIHIISHGNDGQIQLGSSEVNSKNLQEYESQLSGWTTGLAFGGDILLYGCDVAGTAKGEEFVQRFGELTNRDVGASDDLTGHQQLGGDWVLEYEWGQVDSHFIFSQHQQENWNFTLDNIQLTSSKDTYISVANPSDPMGDDSVLQVSRSGGAVGDVRSLIEFDLGAVPSDVTINSATLSLESLTFPVGFGVDLYAVTNPWLEGTDVEGATWNERLVGINWSTPGGDYDSNSIAFSAPDATYAWDVTNLVTDWISGVTANHGVLLGSPSAGQGTVSFSSSESGSGPTLEIDYTPNNHAPVLDNLGEMVLPEISEDASVLIGATVGDVIASAGGDRITDSDAGAVEGIAVIGSDRSDGEWQFNVGSGWSDLGDVSVSNAVVLDTSALIRFVPTADFSGQAGDLTFHAWDQTDGKLSGTIGVSVAELGGSSPFSVVTETVSQSILAINDAPLVSGIENAALEFVEGTQEITITSTITLADIDNGLLHSAMVSIGSNYLPNADVLMFSSMGNITGAWDNVAGILTLSGIDSVDNYQTALRTIEYRNTSESPITGARSIEFAVADGEATSNSQARSIAVIATNDAPQMNYFSGDSLVSLNDGTSRIVDASVEISVHDPDLTTDFSGGRLVINGIDFTAEDGIGILEDSDVMLSDGLLVGSFVSIQGVEVGELISTTPSSLIVEFNSEATTENIGKLIHNTSFATTSSQIGTRVIEFELTDGDGVADGGVDTGYASVSVFVTDQNEGYVSTLEDTTYIFSSSDFDFTGFVGGAIESITITSLPLAGSLALDGSPLEIGDLVAKSQIDAGLLQFVPEPDGHSGFYGSFEFFVNNGVISVNVLAGEPGFRSLGSSFFSDAEAILTELGNFGPGGVVSSTVVIGGPSTSIDADYLSQGEIYFGGAIEDGRLTTAELGAIDQWVLSGGVLISTGEQSSSDDLNEYYGLTTLDAGTTWVVSDSNNPIMDGAFGSVGQVGDTFPAYAITASFDVASLIEGDQVLAVDQNSGNPTIVLRSHGDGKILFTGDTGIFYSDLSGGGTVSTPNDILTANVFSWAIDESNVGTSDKCMQIGVFPVNDAPVIDSGTNEALVYMENDGLVAVLDTLVLSDIDDGEIESATVVISANYQVNEDRLDYTNGSESAIFGIWDSVSGTLQLTGTDTIENYELALRSVTYQNTSESPDPTTRVVSFEIDDGELSSVPMNREIQVVPTNDGPTNLVLSTSVVDENINTGVPGGPYFVGQLSTNDPDIDDVPFYSVLGGSDLGLFQIGGVFGNQLILEDGILDYERQSSYEVVLRVADQSGEFFDKAFTISVQNLNDAPTEIVPNAVSVQENTDTTAGISLGVLTSIDQDLGEQFIYTVESGNDAEYFSIGGINGDELIIQGVSLDFETKADYECVIRSTDSQGLFVDQIISVALTDINETPTLDNQSFSIDENSINGTAVGFLSAVDADVDEVLSYRVIGGIGVGVFDVDQSTGEVFVRDETLLNYETTPMVNLLVEVVDDEGLSDSAEISIQLNDVNDEQILVENSVLLVAEGGVAVIDSSFLRTTDEEQTDDRIVYSVVTAPVKGILKVAGVTANEFTQDDLNENRVSYAHDGTESLSDSFEFLVDDGAGVGTGGVFVISISPVNDAPVARDDTLSINEGASVSANADELMGNDSDADSVTVVTRLVTAPVNGTVELNSDGSFVYTHDGSETLADHFTYQLDDGSLLSSIANVEIQINPVNDAPVGGQDEYSMTTGRVLSAFQSVLLNDGDVEGDSIVAVLVAPPSNGTVVLNPNGSFVYVPNAGFFGVDTFSYVPSDGVADGIATTVSIQVEAAAGPSLGNQVANVDKEVDDRDENNDEYLGAASAIAARKDKRSMLDEEDASRRDAFEKFVPDQIEEYVSLISDRNRAADVMRMLLQNPASEMVVEESEIRNLELNSVVGISINTEYLIDRLKEADRYEASLEDIKMTVGALTTLGTLGYVFWTLRGSALMALALAQLPSWQMIDPLPVLESYTSKDGVKKQDEVDGFFN